MEIGTDNSRELSSEHRQDRDARFLVIISKIFDRELKDNYGKNLD